MLKRRSAIFKLLLTILVCTMFLGGCGEKTAAGPTDSVTFTDSLGRSVTVKRSPERVAALIGSFADVWRLAGGELCAVTEDAEDFGIDMEGTDIIGGAHSPNVESLLAADPDFVIAGSNAASNATLRELLENAGITVAYFDVDSFEDYLAMLDICTDITGRKDLFAENGTKIAEKIAEIKADMAKSPFSEEKRRVLLLRATSGTVKAKGSEGTVLGEMLHELGCVNIADSDTSLIESLSVESVIRMAPYRIFVVTMGDDTEAAVSNVTRMMTENPAWGGLDAVGEGRLHVMEKRLFNLKPNAKWAESYEQLRDILLEK